MPLWEVGSVSKKVRSPFREVRQYFVYCQVSFCLVQDK